VHPTINLDQPDPACRLDYVPRVAREHPHDVVLSTSYGFGGHDAALLLGRWKEECSRTVPRTEARVARDGSGAGSEPMDSKWRDGDARR
jgi:hypothetical protein